MEAKACKQALGFPSDICLNKIGGKRGAFAALNQKGRVASRTVYQARVIDRQWKTVRIGHKTRPFMGLSHSCKDSHGKFGRF